VRVFRGRIHQCWTMLITNFDHLGHTKHYTKTSQVVLPLALNSLSSSSSSAPFCCRCS
jgi:hypothetical protein